MPRGIRATPRKAPPGFLDRVATAEALGVTEATLDVWRATGRYPLPFYKLPSGVFYKKTEVAEFIESFRHEGSSAA